MQDELAKQLTFLAEIDGLKTILRQSTIVSGTRRENSAEHSWHLAMFALILAPSELDRSRIIAMLLIHDLVEIYAGDSPFHVAHDTDALQKAEEAAAQRLFAMLPQGQGTALLDLWNEFEAGDSAEAKFAKALDRFQPLLLNTLTGGGTWLLNNVTQDQVCECYGPIIEKGSTSLWARARALVRRHFDGEPVCFGA